MSPPKTVARSDTPEGPQTRPRSLEQYMRVYRYHDRVVTHFCGLSRREAGVVSQRERSTSQPARGNSSASSSQGSASDSSTNETSIRINKCFKEFASRRESDRFVQDGRVRINDEIAEPGARVQAGDKVFLDGRPIVWEHLNLFEDEARYALIP
eukprot:4342053-Pyramimonas_sp.AAC.1